LGLAAQVGAATEQRDKASVVSRIIERIFFFIFRFSLPLQYAATDLKHFSGAPDKVKKAS
jgi:hypothetical protein